MKTYRTELHGHIIEARQGDLGCDAVLLDGRIISRKLFGGWYGATHFFDLTDEAGRTRHVEVGWVDRSKLGLGKYRLRVRVDGIDRAEVEPLPEKREPQACLHCGYPLTGLPVENGEVRCPECGRHTGAHLLGG